MKVMMKRSVFQQVQSYLGICICFSAWSVISCYKISIYFSKCPFLVQLICQINIGFMLFLHVWYLFLHVWYLFLHVWYLSCVVSFIGMFQRCPEWRDTMKKTSNFTSNVFKNKLKIIYCTHSVDTSHFDRAIYWQQDPSNSRKESKPTTSGSLWV